MCAGLLKRPNVSTSAIILNDDGDFITVATCLNRDPDVKQHFRTPEGIYKLEHATKFSQNSINHKVLK